MAKEATRMKLSKRIILIVCIVLIVAGAVVGGILLHGNIYQRRIEAMIEAEIQAHRESVMPYIRLHYAFDRGADPGEMLTEYQRNRTFEWSGRYIPLPENGSLVNQWGIDVVIYTLLLFYRSHTGNVVPYELVVDYFSEEFEPDGSLRLYNNGNHPEIEGFVTWMWEGRRRYESREFKTSIELIYIDYSHQRRDDESWTDPGFFRLSPQMRDALARAYADSDYVLDLTSIQQAGY